MINAILPSFSESKTIITIKKVVELLFIQAWPSGFGDFNILCYCNNNNVNNNNNISLRELLRSQQACPRASAAGLFRKVQGLPFRPELSLASRHLGHLSARTLSVSSMSSDALVTRCSCLPLLG